MAKIIIRANIVDRNFLIEQRVIDVNIGSSTKIPTTSLAITPIGKAIIAAEDFYTGILEDNIKSINFSQSGSKVMANVDFYEFTPDSQLSIINLPISGFIKITTSSIKLIESSPIDNNIVSSTSSYGITSSGIANANTVVEHIVSGDAGQTVNVLTKSFTVPSGFTFVELPNYKMSNSASGYRIKSIPTKDAKGVITSMTFHVTYTFTTVLRAEKVDTITFSYSKKEAKQYITAATKKSEEKIYSMSTGKEIGPEGGSKMVIVRGLPGSSFKIMTKNSNNEGYNYTTGAFGNFDGFLKGTIPPARPGYGYGEFRANIIVPASTTGETVTTRIDSGAVIDHKELVKYIKDPTVRVDVRNIPTKNYEDLQKETITLTIACEDGGEEGFTITTPMFEDSEPTVANTLSAHFLSREFGDLEKDGVYTCIGAANTGIIQPIRILKNSGQPSSTFTFVILSLVDDKFIYINREPRFNSSDDYIQWTGIIATTPLKDSVSDIQITMDAGTSITNGVGNSIVFGSDIKFSASVRGLGESKKIPTATTYLSNPVNAYKAILLKVDMHGALPTSDVNMQINLSNFLTIP